MDTTERSQLVGAIVTHLQFAAREQGKVFDAGDTFFSLCFKSDDELMNIAKLAGV